MFGSVAVSAAISTTADAAGRAMSTVTVIAAAVTVAVVGVSLADRRQQQESPRDNSPPRPEPGFLLLLEAALLVIGLVALAKMFQPRPTSLQ